MSEASQPFIRDKKKRDVDALVAFWLAFFIMVAPTEADLLAMLLPLGHVALFYVIATLCFLLVFCPWWRSVRKHRRQPGVWNGRGYLIATGVILSLNLLAIGAISIEWLRGAWP